MAFSRRTGTRENYSNQFDDQHRNILENPLLLQDLLNRKHCQHLEEEFNDIQMIFKNPIQAYQVIRFETLNKLYNSGLLSVRLESDNKNRLGEPTILVLHPDPSIHYTSILAYAHSVDTNQFWKTQDCQILDCNDRYFILYCDGFMAFWEIVGCVVQQNQTHPLRHLCPQVCVSENLVKRNFSPIHLTMTHENHHSECEAPDVTFYESVLYVFLFKFRNKLKNPIYIIELLLLLRMEGYSSSCSY